MAEKTSFWSSVPGMITAVAGLLTAIGTLIGALYSAGIVGRDDAGEPREVSAPAERAAANVESAPDVRPSVSEAASRQGASTRTFRSATTVLSDNAVNALLVRHGFYDSKRNQSGTGIPHEYQIQAIGDSTVVLDETTALMWQRGGSDPMPRDDADRYVQRLNAEKFAGFSDWRLPTVEEAMSLMEPQSYDGVHIAPAFARNINFIWTGDSSDRTSDRYGWVLYFYDGVVTPERVRFNAWVRAVRSSADRR
jgi:hypothetical protein